MQKYEAVSTYRFNVHALFIFQGNTTVATLVLMQDQWWSPPGAAFQTRIILTERIDVLPDGQGETADGVVDAEKDHGHVLRGAHACPQRGRVAVIHVALVQRQRVVLGTGELLPFHHPAVKHLHGTVKQTFDFEVWGRTVDSRSVGLNSELREEIWQQVVWSKQVRYDYLMLNLALRIIGIAIYWLWLSKFKPTSVCHKNCSLTLFRFRFVLLLFAGDVTSI